MEAKLSFEMEGTTRPTTRHHIREEFMFQQHRCDNSKFHISINCMIMLILMNSLEKFIGATYVSLS